MFMNSGCIADTIRNEYGDAYLRWKEAAANQLPSASSLNSELAQIEGKLDLLIGPNLSGHFLSQTRAFIDKNFESIRSAI